MCAFEGSWKALLCFEQEDKMKCYEITKNLMIFTTLYSYLAEVADSIGVQCACLHYSFMFKV
jgi:hypothetical protein